MEMEVGKAVYPVVYFYYRNFDTIFVLQIAYYSVEF